jgi:hypothetical protein
MTAHLPLLQISAKRFLGKPSQLIKIWPAASKSQDNNQPEQPRQANSHLTMNLGGFFLTETCSLSKIAANQFLLHPNYYPRQTMTPAYRTSRVAREGCARLGAVLPNDGQVEDTLHP